MPTEEKPIVKRRGNVVGIKRIIRPRQRIEKINPMAVGIVRVRAKMPASEIKSRKFLCVRTGILFSQSVLSKSYISG